MTRQGFVHIVARALPGHRPFANDERAHWLWRRLRDTFPDAVAACLMPNHLHLIGRGPTPESLAHLLSGFTRHVEQRRMWEAVPPPKTIPDAKHLVREVRYVHLNPCRDGLVPDPLSWPWSTHRGVLGAEHDPWVSASRLADALGWSFRNFASRFHDYVSGDPHVAVAGTPLPRPAEPRNWLEIPLEIILAAASSATVWSSLATRRHAAALLAAHQGWDDARIVATALRISRQWARRLMTQHAPSLLAPSLLCLGDARLRNASDPATRFWPAKERAGRDQPARERAARGRHRFLAQLAGTN